MTPRNFGCPKGVEKSELFSQESYHSQNFIYETLKSPILKKLKCAPLTSLPVKVTNDTFLLFLLIKECMNMNEYMIEV